MIYEIAITPQAFEQMLGGDDYIEQLGSLANWLFPDDELGNVIVADLDTDNWERSIRAVMARMPPTKKYWARDLIEKILLHLEQHPRQLDLLLEEKEDGWINEAGSGINAGLVDAVFASSKAPKRERSWRTAALRDAKWRTRKFRRSGVDILTEENQEEVFQRVLRLCDWCFIDLPYLADSVDNESITAVQLVKVGSKSGTLRNSPLHIDIRSPEDKERSLRSGNLESILERAIQHSDRNREVSCSVYCCDDKKNRAMFAGLLTGLDCGRANRKLRWRIQMPHVRSRFHDEAEGDWSVTPFSDAKEKCDRLRLDMKADRSPIFTIGDAPTGLSW